MYLVLILLITTCAGHSLNGRILGGSDASIGQFPHMVSLRYDNDHICGGSVLNNNWVLTAAHCVFELPQTSLTVVVGTNKLSSGGATYNVQETHSHPDYDAVQIKNDIALLKVNTITYDDAVSPVQLDTEFIGGDEPCQLSGWGYTTNNVIGNELPDDLQQINLRTITVKQCQDFKLSVDDNQLCTFTKSGEGFCTYDSGGPLIKDVAGVTKQIGVVSWMMACARGYPDVFTRISAYHSWITDLILSYQLE